MQRPRPSGGLHRFFAPVCAVTAALKEREAKVAKEEKEKENVDDETEIDVPAPPSSSPLLLRPPATKPLVESADDAPRVTYSRRKKEAKRPAECDDDEKEEECPAALPLSTTTTATTTTKHPPPQKKKKALTQAHLDLGQRAFVCLTCPQCGMVYAPGDARDERVHATFHADALQGPRLSLGRASSSSAASSSSSSSSSLVEVISFPPSLGSGNGSHRGGNHPPLRGRVLHAPPGPALAGAGVGRALAVAEAALGAVPGWLLGLCPSPAAGAARDGAGEEEERGEGGSGAGEPASSPSSSPSSFQRRPAPPRPLTAAAALRCGKHAFLFECSETRRAVGVAVVEALASGTRLRRVGGDGGGSGGEGGAEGAEATTTAGAAGAALGVRGVWVSPSHRRRGVASALLDAARARAVAYTVVGRRALVVFSQPTEAGGGEALARSYAGGRGGGGFWSYL